jgi:hypothetical protein
LETAREKWILGDIKFHIKEASEDENTEDQEAWNI